MWRSHLFTGWSVARVASRHGINANQVFQCGACIRMADWERSERTA